MMTFELLSVVGAVGILFFLLMYQGALVPINQGFGWGLGSRDKAQEFTAMQGRAARAVANHLEGLAMFVPLVLVAHIANVSTELTVLGCIVFLVSRAAFAILYLAGVPVLRSIAWGASIIGLLMIAYELIRAAL